MSFRLAGLYLTFKTKEGSSVNVKVGLSYTSVENARLNLESEAKDLSFDKAWKSAVDMWNDYLGRIMVEGGTDEDMTKFYTGLYHALLGRGVASDVNGAYPKNDGGVGTNFVSLAIASAYNVGIRNFDVETGYEAALKNEIEGDNRPEGAGKMDVGLFVKYGYSPYNGNYHMQSTPQGSGFAASHTMEYAFSSYAVAQLAKHLILLHHGLVFRRVTLCNIPTWIWSGRRSGSVGCMVCDGRNGSVRRERVDRD
jgi:putative alpha-1,2-mannosidase